MNSCHTEESDEFRIIAHPANESPSDLIFNTSETIAPPTSKWADTLYKMHQSRQGWLLCPLVLYLATINLKVAIMGARALFSATGCEVYQI